MRISKFTNLLQIARDADCRKSTMKEKSELSMFLNKCMMFDKLKISRRQNMTTCARINRNKCLIHCERNYSFKQKSNLVLPSHALCLTSYQSFSDGPLNNT